jgi:hypothetical protein
MAYFPPIHTATLPPQISSGSCERVSRPPPGVGLPPSGPFIEFWRETKPSAPGPRGWRMIVGLSPPGVVTLAGSIGTGGGPSPKSPPSPPAGARRAGDAIVAKPSRMFPFDGRAVKRGAAAPRSAPMSGIDFFVRSDGSGVAWFAAAALRWYAEGARERRGGACWACCGTRQRRAHMEDEGSLTFSGGIRVTTA